MAIQTQTINKYNIDATKLNVTFQWETLGFDTVLISSVLTEGSADTDPTDPQWTIEESMDLIDWYGTTTLNHQSRSSEITITASHMRLRLTTPNSTAARLSVSAQLRKDL